MERVILWCTLHWVRELKHLDNCEEKESKTPGTELTLSFYLFVSWEIIVYGMSTLTREQL